MLLRSGRWLSVLFAALTSSLQAAAEPAVVIAVQVRGTVEVLRGGSGATETVADGAQLTAPDTVSTAGRSSVMLVLPNGAIVALKEKSRLRIAIALHSGPAFTAAADSPDAGEPGVSRTGFDLEFGEMLTRVRRLNPASSFTVQTPVSVAAVRGTVFEIAYQPDTPAGAQYRLATASGLVHVTPHAGKEILVPANAQLDLTAELDSRGVTIKQVKASELDRKKAGALQREAQDNDRRAAESLQRLPASPTAATDRATDQLKEKAAASGATRDDVKTAVTDRAKANAAQSSGANRVTKPATPKIPPRVKTIKRPPRRPGG